MIGYLMAAIAILALVMAGLLVRGPTVWDRLQALSVLSSKIVILIVLYSLVAAPPYVLDVALVYSLLGFAGLMLIARAVGRRGRI